MVGQARLFSIVLIGAALLAGFASPARALVFTSPIAYVESFTAEQGFPTTPDADLLSAEGVVALAESGAPPSLTASSVALTVSQPDSRDGVEAVIETDAISTLEYDAGLRTAYHGLSFSGEGEAWLLHALQFTLDDHVAPGGTYAASFVSLRRIGALHQATLWILEEHEGAMPPGHLVTQSVPLPTATADRLFAGDPFVLDLEVDRQAGAARASIAVGSDPEIATPPLSLSFAHDYSIARAFQRLDLRGFEFITVALELDALQIRAVPRTFEGRFNVDVGTFWGTPPPSFPGVVEPGFWNKLALGTSPLFDLNGSATGVTAQLLAQSLGLVEANGGETRDLMADWARDPGGWTVGIDGLPTDGVYRVTVFAFGPGAAESGTLFANGATHASLTGVVVPSLVEHASFARIETWVSGGALDLAGLPIAGASDLHLSGFQIEEAVPVPEPAFAHSLAVSLCLMSMLGGRRRIGR